MHHSQCLFIIYELLNNFFGDLNWWPGESAFEVIIGAILTQNTAWQNVELAISRLKSQELISPEGLMMTRDDTLEEIIKSSGYYRIKTKRIKSFLHFMFQYYNGNLEKMFAEDIWCLREKLLHIKGIGEETADSILLYAGNKPVFVVDAYTRRILERHRLINQNASYKEIQKFFVDHLPSDISLYKQYHALLVNTGKAYCKLKPKCNKCPLSSLDTSLD